MPLPVTVSTNREWPGNKNVSLGPYENGSNLYTFLGGTDAVVEALKSTDGGEVWTAQDTADEGTDEEVCDIQVIGTTAYVLKINTTDNFVIRKFDMSTDQWVALESGMTTSPPSQSFDHISGVGFALLVVRGDGDYVILHNGATESVMGSPYRRIKYSRFQSGAWTINVRADNGTGDEFHWDARAAQLGSSSRSHFFYTKTGSVNVFFQKALTSANVLQAEGSSSTGSNFGSAWVLGNPIAYVDGADTKVVVPYASDEDGAPTALAFGVIRFTSADAPTLSHQQVSPNASHPPLVATSNPGAAAVDGTTPYVFWGDAITDDLWHDNDAGTGTWGTDVKFYPAPQIAQNTAGTSVSFYGEASGSSDKLAQSFVATADVTFRHLRVRLGKQGTPTDNLLVTIRTALDGTVLGTATVTGASLGADADLVVALDTAVSITNGSTYYIQFERSGAMSGTNYFKVGTNSAGGYASGSLREYNGSWTVFGTYDAYFSVPHSPLTAVQGISVGKITDAIGILYNDNGTVKYDKLDLGGEPPEEPPPQARRAAIRMTR